MAHDMTPTRHQSTGSLPSTLPFTLVGTQSPGTGNISCTPNGRGTSPRLSPSPRRYTFTPQPVRPLPRAWERRPATPHIPRNDAQKIWKRIPLGPIDLSDGLRWRKGHQTVGRRSVKRLRVGQITGEGEDADDKENITYVASKWDEDSIMAASPKRKAFGYDGTADAETTPDAPGKALTQANSDSNSDSDKDGHVMHKINDPDPSITKGAENISTTVAVVQNNVVPFPIALHSASCSPAGGNPSPTPLLLAGLVGARSPNPSFLPATGSTESDSLTSRPQPFNSEEEGEVQIQLDGARTEPHPAEVINFPIDHDDFPFLQNFLSRSQARKAAKHDNPRQDAQSCDGPIEMASHASEEPTPTCVEGSGGGGLEASTTSPVGDRNDLSTTPSYSHTDIGTVEPDQEADVNLSSPCRRSSRLNGKAARPKKPAATLPSNISLKRLNGTEFIATQREAQPLAVTTRTNTKRNKGDSVSVKVKLIQLHAEEKARESDPNTGTQEVSRNKPVSKQVKWDDTLARFEDGSIFHNDRDGEALDDEADKLEQSSDKEADQNQQEPPKPSEPAQAEDKPARKVRKLRKLNVGSVNGTPGPKRTTSIPVPVGAGSLEKLTDIIAKGKGGEAKVAGGERAQTRYQRQLRKSG